MTRDRTDRATVADRLQKLFAMAGSPVEEEARTAALMFVRLMKKHGMVPVLPAPAAEDHPARVHTPQQPTPQQQPPPQPGAGQWQHDYQPPRAYHPPGYDKYRSVKAAKQACCKACGQLYEMGEPVLVGVKRHGVTHERCRAYWNE